VPAAEQRRALSAVLATIKPEALAIPESLLKILPPRPPEYERGREHFKIRTYPAFDALAPAEAASQHTLQFLFTPERAARLIEFHARDSANPSLGEVLDAVLGATWSAQHPSGYAGQIANVVDNVVLYNLMALASNEHASDEVRAEAWSRLMILKRVLQGKLSDSADGDHRAFALRQIELFERDPKRLDPTPPSDPPDGPPIGDEPDWD
jgi:hypothetical protein